MLVILYPLAVALLGLFLFFSSEKNPKWQRVGEILLLSGVLVLVYLLGSDTLKL